MSVQKFRIRLKAFYLALNGLRLHAVFPYFAVMNLLSMKPQFTRIRADLLAYGTLEYLILHCQNLTRNYPFCRYIKQCDCIDTTASRQALLSLKQKMQPQPCLLKRNSIFQGSCALLDRRISEATRDFSELLVFRGFLWM